MYGWLQSALEDSGCVLTGNRRLARALRAEFSERQIAAGLVSWPTPDIRPWKEWVDGLFADDPDGDLPGIRLNQSQSRVVWERCLEAGVDETLPGRGSLLSEVRDAWDRLHEWQVPIDACARHARSRDHHFFVGAARRYSAALAEHGWTDRVRSRSAAVASLMDGRKAVLPRRVTLAGFDRTPPLLETLVAGLEKAGTRISWIRPKRQPAVARVHEFESVDAELRAAGRWARAQLEDDPAASVAVVVPRLEREASRMTRLVQETLVPGWQLGGRDYARVVNVSLGRRLADYPAVAVASTLLQWVYRDISSADLSRLLCSPFLAAGDLDARCMLDQALRRRPWQTWTPESFERWCGRVVDDSRLEGWNRAVLRLASERARAAGRAMPADWAALFDSVLDTFGWPGSAGLDSEGFQLVNRWRELLNELAQLQLVTGTIRAAEGGARLALLAAEAVFQPESRAPGVQLLGPLEAAGLEFDRLWLAGLTSADWPPPSRPMALVSRDLQRLHGMPDAEPRDTAEYGRAVLARLAASAPDVTASYPRQRDDAEQSPCGLLAAYRATPVEAPEDPGWGSGRFDSCMAMVTLERERVPAIGAGEVVAGGAATIQRQLQEPFSAFVHGRLGVRPLLRLAPGIRAWFRGNVLHDLMRHLYAGVDSRGTLADWGDSACTARALESASRATGPHYRDADALVRRLLELEEERGARLARAVLALDLERDDFVIDGVEQSVEIELAGLFLRLRIDRVDRVHDGGRIIWDYKTGRSRRFMRRDGEPDDYQLVVYSLALPAPIAGLGYFNIDSRSVAMDSAGIATLGAGDWEQQLAGWQATVLEAAAAIAGGDVRLNDALSDAQRRPLALLSRYREAGRDQ